MIIKKICTSVFLFGVLLSVLSPASASERLCDGSFENCKTPLITLIQNEKVEIDVAFWFMGDSSLQNALMQRIKAGVKVRMLVDPRADEGHPTNTTILQQFAAMTPAVPMRQRIETGILHWKMMLFAGQGVVEFSGANFSQSEMVPVTPYQNYVDEAIYYSDDPAIVNSFRTMYDKWWVDNVNYTDYAHTSGTTLAPSYAVYPIDSEACAAVPDACGMNFLPSSRWQDDYGNKTEAAIKAENVKLDIDMFRITNAAITDATIAAFQRHLPVRMIVDSSEYTNVNRVWDRYNVDRLFMAGIPIKITKHAGQNHEKAVLFYGQGLTVWGSSNWTRPSFNSQQEHNFFSTSAVKPWFFQWFVNQFERRWNSPQEYTAFVPMGPGPPTNKNPANAATALNQSLTLTWDGGPWGQMFDIYLGTGTTGPLQLIASNVVTGDPDPAPNHVFGTFKISGLAPNTTYRWMIVSKTMANLSAGGPVWSFTTGGTAPTSGATVASISPATGPSAGGTAVTITGTNFAAGATVSFGFGAASHVVVVNSTTITATTPPSVGGSANVKVVNPDGTSGSLAGGFAYTSTPPSTQPQLNVVTPNTGSSNGGEAITISGSNLLSATSVKVGGTAAAITHRSSVSIQAATPPGTVGSAVDIVVATPSGSATLPAAFTYANSPDPPSLTAISPSSGSFNGGTRVILSGSGFRYGAVVSFGGPPPPIGTGTPATTMAVTDSSTVCGGAPRPCIMATTPPFATGAADVVVTNLNPATGVIDGGSGTSKLTAGYTFLLAPAISSMSPSSGSVSGGTQIVITGTDFAAGATVFVGNRQATITNTTGSTSITATTPANSAGTSAVTVVNPDGQSSNSLIFTYQ